MTRRHRIIPLLVASFIVALAVSALATGSADPAAAETAVEQTVQKSFIQHLLGNPIIATFATIAIGMAIGKIKVAGISLGSSGVLFAALLLGHLGYNIPQVVGQIGLVLFVYCVGVAAGPSFFRAFAKSGKTLTILALLIVASGAFTTIVLGHLLDLPPGLAVGIFAGALTSTPALAAGTEALPGDVGVSVGYGLAYPFGVIGVVLFVQLLPRLLRRDLDQLADDAKRKDDAGDDIVRTLIEVTNPAIFGRGVADVDFIEAVKCRIVRSLDDGHLRPITTDFRFHEGTVVLVISRQRRVRAIVDLLGRVSDEPYVLDTENERRTVVVTSDQFIGKSIGDLDPLANYGVEISRFTRQGLTFVPPRDEKFQPGDKLNVVGYRENLQRFATAAGDRPQMLDETDLISLALGISLGVLIGTTRITLPGSGAIMLGLAGGPLLVALILAHFGRVGPIVGYLPRASRLIVMELGLVLFLAQAGASAGGSVVEVVQTHGIALLFMAATVLIVPIAIAMLAAHFMLRLGLLESLGGVCGGMTSTPGLGAITAKTDADIPVIAYAAAYPVALILMTVFAKLIPALM